ncbi:anthranilate synthase component I, N terminal region-domain-containing protein, partial [Russula brevipes]
VPAIPSLDDLERLVFHEERGNLVPAYIQLPADPITPVIAYLRIAHNSKYSFLLESVVAGENVARYSFIGADPFKLVKIRPNEAVKGDPMHVLEHELSVYKYVKIPQVPTFTGGAIGYIANDVIQPFEPKTARPLKDNLGRPSSCSRTPCSYMTTSSRPSRSSHMYFARKTRHLRTPHSSTRRPCLRFAGEPCDTRGAAASCRR